MKIGKLEMKALIGIIAVIFVFTSSTIYIGKKNHWLTPSVKFITTVTDADSLRVGGKVTLAGLRVGQITKLDVNDDNLIEIQFEVYKTKANKINEGTEARIVRAFLIGEKSIDLLPGPKGGKILAPDSKVLGIDSKELPDLIAGKNIGQLFNKVEGLGTGIDKLFSAVTHFSEKIGEKELTQTWKLVPPFLKNTSALAKQLSDNQLARRTFQDTRALLKPLKKHPEKIENLLIEANTLISGLAKNPQFTEEMSVALKEIIITLKAAQKTWILEDQVEELKRKK